MLMVLVRPSRSADLTTVEPRLADTPEKQTPQIIRTLSVVPNEFYICLYISETPEMRTPRTKELISTIVVEGPGWLAI